MINASILLKNKEDKHLNVFWQYEGKPGLENNITKALINTFESLKDSSKKKFIKTFFEIPTLQGEITYKYYLQKSPDEKEIKSIKESNRLLFAFSPTGKSWGEEGIAINNTSLIKKSIRESLVQSNPTKDEEEIDKIVNEQLAEIKNIIEKKGDSIPDAWIVIQEDNKPKYCIAMENKLYDLNPYQLNNHCKKSLYMKQNNIKYAKYSKILEELYKLNGYLVDDFLRYMYFLNYWTVDNLSELEGMDEEHIEKYATERCCQLLREISHKEVTWHRGWMYRFMSNNEFNREVGMWFDSDSSFFQIPLYFGSTQNSAKSMYDSFADLKLKINKKYTYWNSFHFQYSGIGKNISETYYEDENFDIEMYIKFWIQNSNCLHQMDKKERAKLLRKMLSFSIIPQSEYPRLLRFSNGYDKELSICPEFCVACEWNYEKAQKLDAKGLFAREIQQFINTIYNQFNINES